MAFDIQRELRAYTFDHYLAYVQAQGGNQDVATLAHLLDSAPTGYKEGSVERSYRLGMEAAYTLDYELPQAAEEDQIPMIQEALQKLKEAIELDDGNREAERVYLAVTEPSIDVFLEWLDHTYETLKYYTDEALNSAIAQSSEALNDDTILWMVAPYLRHLEAIVRSAWLNNQCMLAYRVTLDYLHACSQYFGRLCDPADLRRIMYLAGAKLQDERMIAAAHMLCALLATHSPFNTRDYADKKPLVILKDLSNFTNEEAIRITREAQASGSHAFMVDELYFCLAALYMQHKSGQFISALNFLDRILDFDGQAASDKNLMAQRKSLILDPQALPAHAATRTTREFVSDGVFKRAIADATPLLFEGGYELQLLSWLEDELED